MATTKIWAVKANLQYTLSYASNPDKTEMEKVLDYLTGEGKTIKENLCTGINCDIETAYQDMMFVKEQFGKTGGILAHHAEQSFKPGEITPEKAHKIGVKFADEMWGDRFQVIVTTHLDKAHIHNHFVINSVSFVDGRKYNGCKATYRNIRELSDKYCRQEGLSIIKDVDQGKQRYMAESSGKFNLRTYIKNDIDIAILRSRSMEEFYASMRKMGYSLKFGKHFAVSPAGKDGYIRLRSIKDDDYTLEGIRQRIAENYSRNYGVLVKSEKTRKKCKRPKRKLTGYMALYYRYLFLLGKIPGKKRPKRIPYRVAKQVAHLDKISREVRLIGKYNLINGSDLKALQTKLENNLDEHYLKRETLRKEIRRKIPEKQKVAIRLEITSLTEKMREIRAEIRICGGIEIRSKTKVDRDKEVKRKGERINEHGRRDRRSDR